jgi:hypothetical protein
MSTVILTPNHYAIQHVVTGTGTFNGTPAGYAGVQYDGGSGDVIDFLAHNAGTDTNNIKVGWSVPPGKVGKTEAIWNAQTKTLTITPRANGGVILATTQEVVNAVNGYKFLPRMQGGGRAAEEGYMPVTATTAADALIVGAFASTNMENGLDPDVRVYPGVIRYALPLNRSGGAFLFDHEVPWRITNAGGRIAVATAYVVRVANMFSYDTESLLLGSGTSDADGNFGLTGGDIGLIMPKQAVIVEAACAGSVFVYGVPAYRN